MLSSGLNDMSETKKKRRSYRRMSWTGEDIDMLRERDENRKSDRASSDDYKNHIDGA